MEPSLSEVLKAHLAFKRILRQVLLKDEFDEDELRALFYYALTVIEGCLAYLGNDRTLLSASTAISELYKSPRRRRQEIMRISRLVTQAVCSLIEKIFGRPHSPLVAM